MFSKRNLAAVFILGLFLGPMTAGLAQAKNLAEGRVLPAAVTWYVDHSAAGANNGSSWANAYTSLQSALVQAQAGEQVWVAEGVYVPTSAADRTATFSITSGLALYGGFDPANGADAWEERDWMAHITVLSGDLDGNDTTDSNGVLNSWMGIFGNNAYHVVSTSSTLQATMLDGFVVTGGDATGSFSWEQGGGMFNNNSLYLLISNVIFSGNKANYGGGLSNVSSYLDLMNVTFFENKAYHYGGGMRSVYGQSNLTNVRFIANQASDGGGGMSQYYNNSFLINGIFTANEGGTDCGAIYLGEGSSSQLDNVSFAANSIDGICGGDLSSSVNIRNSILWGSPGEQIRNPAGASIFFSDIQGGCPPGATCVNVINANPLFARPPDPGPDATWFTADDDYGDLRLQLSSPAIDAGNNTYLPEDILDLDGDGNSSERTPLDLWGVARFMDVPYVSDNGVTDPPTYPFVVDFGAYETFPWSIYLPLTLKR
jgi:hypothetical protein